MSKKANALLVLWKMGRVTQTALRKAVTDGVITTEELELILNA